MNNIIYKYLPTERKTYLEDELLRFTQPRYLNDPFECLPAKWTDLEIINKLRSENPLIRLTDVQILSIRDAYQKNFLKTKDERFGILSLSTRWNSTLMWSHYSNKHSGFCIGFNKDDPYFRKTLPEGLYKSVEYSKNRVAPFYEDNNSLEFAFIKAEDWSYEKEERLILPLFSKHKVMLNEFDEEIFLFKVPHRLINEIIVGVNTNQSLTDEIIKLSKALNIKLYRSKISDTEFDMERVEM